MLNIWIFLWFHVKDILIATSEQNFRDGLTRSKAKNGNMYLYVPPNRDERHMLERLSKKPYLELSEEKIQETLADEEQLSDISNSLLRELKMECHYRSPPVQITEEAGPGYNF